MLPLSPRFRVKAEIGLQPSVFVSYRRSDVPGYAGRLYDHLKPTFGKEHVFMDIDTLEIGVDFSARIGEALDECHALLAVIGPSWLDVKDENGNRRLDDPRDFVRKEILAALIRDDVLVIPVLVQGAFMPNPEKLPTPLQPLAFRNALKLTDEHWEYDMGRLADAIRRAAKHESTSTLHDQRELAKPLEKDHAKEETKEEARTVVPPPPPPPTPHRDVRPMWFAIAGGVALVMLVVLFTLLRDSNDDSNVPSGSDAINGRIAFLSDESGSTHLVTMEPDGSDPQPLADYGPGILRPDWSPDGTKLVFPTDRGGDYDLWTVNADGSELEQLTSGPGREQAPDWSPDGRSIAFSNDPDGNRDVYVIDVETGDETRLTDDPAHDDTPDWSRTDRIVFVNGSDGDLDIWTMNPAGGEREQITFNDAADWVPEWSPDGASIVYRSNDGGNVDIWTVGSDGSGASNLTNTEDVDHHPAWSPDGEFIVFDSFVGGNTDIRVMTSTGENVHDLLSTSSNEDSPSWQAILD